MSFDEAILWHVYPLGFVGAADSGAAPAHRLARITGWLDHAVRLGASVVQLGPIFASESHGYDTTDHLRIDPRLGDDADFDRFVAEAHARGLRVVLDGVFNHVARSFGRFRDAVAGDADAARWFRRDGDDWAVFEGHGALVALNHDEPAVREYVIRVLNHWADRGVDGWRLDAAYAVPTDFWRAVTDAARGTHPELWFLAEVIHGDYAAFAAAAGVDSVTQYELWKAIWSSLNDANPHELAWTLQRHQGWLDSMVPTTFVGNHDVTRIASRLADVRHLPHALTVLATVGGHPAIYAGDEFGWLGVKEDRAGGDDAVRPEFPASPDELEDAPVFRLHQRLIGLRRRNPWLVRAVVTPLRVEPGVFVYRSADPADDARSITVALNLREDPIAVDPPAGQVLLEGGLGAHEAAVFGVPLG